MMFYPGLMCMAIALTNVATEPPQTPERSIEIVNQWLLQRQGATASNQGAQQGSSNSYHSGAAVPTNNDTTVTDPQPMQGGGGGGGRGPRVRITALGPLTPEAKARLARHAGAVEELRALLRNSPALSAAIPSINSVIAVDLRPDGTLEAFTP